MGDLRILDLTIAEPNSATDPWLRVKEARIDVHLGQLLCGNCEPNEILVDDFWLRIWRKKDGTPEIGDLLRDRSDSSTSIPALIWRSRSRSRPVGDTSRSSTTPGGTRLDFTEIQASGTRGPRLVSIDELKARLNGGTFAMAAKLDRDPVMPRFEAEARASAVEIDTRMPVLGFFVPVVAGATEGHGGKFDLMLALKGQGTTCAEIRRSLRGQGSVVLDPIDLESSKFLGRARRPRRLAGREPDRLGCHRLHGRKGADLHRRPDDPRLSVPLRPERLDRLRWPVRLQRQGRSDHRQAPQRGQGLDDGAQSEF